MNNKYLKIVVFCIIVINVIIVYNTTINVFKDNSISGKGNINYSDDNSEELNELLRQTSLFKNYPSKIKEITKQHEQKQLERRQVIDEINKINQLYRNLQSDINYSIIFFSILIILPIIVYISTKLYKSYNQYIERIENDIKSKDKEINQIIEDLPLIQFNHIKPNSQNSILSEMLLVGFKERYQDSSNYSSGGSNVLLKFEDKIKDLEVAINERRKKEFSNMGNLLFLTNSKSIVDNKDFDHYIHSITNIESDDKIQLISETEYDNLESSSSTIGPINQDKEQITNNDNSDNDKPISYLNSPSSSTLDSTSPIIPDLNSPSTLEKSISESNLILSNNNNNNLNYKKKDVKKNYEKSSRSYKNNKKDKQLRRISLELQKDIYIMELKRYNRLKDEADKEEKRIKEEFEKEERIKKQEKEKQERIRKEMKDIQEEIKSTKFLLFLIKLMLIINILPELYKLFRYHIRSLSPTIRCITLSELFKISTKDIINHSRFNPLYLGKLFVNHFILDTSSPNIDSINNNNNIFNCIPTSIDINWKLWALTIIYIFLIIIALYFQTNFFITSIIFIVISLSTYKINYNDINNYFPHIIFNLLIILGAKQFNQKIKQSNYSTIIRVFIALSLIIYNYLAFNYFLCSKHLLTI